MLQGPGRFTDDIAEPHALYVAFVRSPVASGIVRDIDVSEALTRPGVLEVITSAARSPCARRCMTAAATVRRKRSRWSCYGRRSK